MKHLKRDNLLKDVGEVLKHIEFHFQKMPVSKNKCRGLICSKV